MVNMDPIHRELYQVSGDTECWRNGDGYDRTLILRQWDEVDPQRVARVKIRVDRYPGNSYAHVDVWVPTTGWQYITSSDPNEWWSTMPGYTRAQTIASDRETMNVVDDLVERLIETRI